MTADGINDRESFAAWLNERPEAMRRQVAVALSHRAAMRAMPFLQRRGKMTLGRHSKLISAWFRRNAISRISGTAPIRDINHSAYAATAEDAENAYTFAPADDAAVSAFAFANTAANDAAPSGGYAAHAYEAHTAADFDDATDRATAYSAYSASAAAAYWRQQRIDEAKLEQGLPLDELVASRLWDDEPEFWHREYLLFSRLLGSEEMTALGFGIWNQWYDAAYIGKPAFGVGNQELRQTLERNIALGSTDGKFDEEFWKHPIHDINADIRRWVEEARAEDERLSHDDNNDKNEADLTEQDFRSRPASIQTTVRNGKVVLERDDPLTDLPEKTAEAAVTDLAKALREIAGEADALQADPRAVAFMKQASEAIEKAVHDQEMLFESGRNQKALDAYASTVDAEWHSMLAARYHALVAQFAQTLNRFEAWRNFAAKPVSPEEPAAPTDVAANVETVVNAFSSHSAAFDGIVLQRLNSLLSRFRLAVNRQQLDDPSQPVWTLVPDALQSDVVVSLSNVLLSYAQNGLMHYGPKIAEGASFVADKAAYTVGAMAVSAALGGSLIFLQKKYPGLFDTAKKAMKQLRKIIKETEPD